MKSNEIRKEYMKERRRILNAIRRGEKQGYVFSEKDVPKILTKPTQKSVERLSKIKPKDLYKRAEWVDIETGEIEKAEKHREEVKKIGHKKAVETRKRKQKKPKHYETSEVEKEKKKAHKKDVESRKRKQKKPKHYEPPKEATGYPMQPTGNEPTITILDKIREYILSIPDQRGFAKGRQNIWTEDYSQKKNALALLLEDRYSDTEETELEAEFLSKQDEIAELVAVIKYDSDSTIVNYSFVKLAVLIKGSSLTIDEAEKVNELTEQMNGWDD